MPTAFRASIAFGAVALLFAADLAAQQGPVARTKGREVINWDFRPDGAFRRNTRAVQKVRGAALARGDLAALNGPLAPAVTGDFKVPVVFVQYADSVATGQMADTTDFHSVFFSANPGADPVPRLYSLKTYYEQLSNGNITMDGALFGWVTTPYTFAYVGANCTAIRCNTGLTRLGQFLSAALDSLNTPGHQVDWSQFDSDGDGYVDFVTFVHPTIGAECPGSFTSNFIWSHRYFMGPGGLRGSNYVTNTPRPGHPGQFMRISDYIIEGAQGGNGSCTAGQIMPMGTVAHETGHAFNIPDLYCAQGCIGSSEGVGEWSLMGSGNYARPYSPAAWDAWSLLTVGWVAVDSLTSSRTVSLNPVQTSDTVLVAPIAGSDEYLILENRAFLQSDTAQMATGYSRRKLPGLLVWHIDSAIVSGGLGSNSVNSGDIEGIHLIQADGLENLHAGSNRGDVGDSYPGSAGNHSLTYHSSPAMLKNDGSPAGFVIDSIQQASATGPIVFRFRRSAPFRVTSNAVSAGSQLSVNGLTTSAFEEIFALGDSIAITIADTQLVNAGRTSLAFQSWSDAGLRSHTIISDGTPDTITATVATSHRINFVANGNGTVGTSGPATNTFVAAGTPVTLTATPNSGQAFTNWTGDTTTSNAVLVLPMNRPYNLTANFTGAVAVSYDQATAAILGGTPLSGAQVTFLDASGNNNAVYDLGDYLAYLKANGLVTAPPVPQPVRPVPSKEK